MPCKQKKKIIYLFPTLPPHHHPLQHSPPTTPNAVAMDSPIHGGSLPLLVFLLLLSAVAFTLALSEPAKPWPTLLSTTAGAAQINSNSVLVALLDSHYTELVELIEKALLLPTLEATVGSKNLTIFAPHNDALKRDLNPEFKRFLLEPSNIKSLQTLILFHVIPSRVRSHSWPGSAKPHRTHAGDHLHLASDGEAGKRVGGAAVLHLDTIVCPDGVIHGIKHLLLPRSVQEDFNRRRSLATISVVLPNGTPEVDPRTHRLPLAPAESPLALPIHDALAPGPSITPAPAPGPGSGKKHFDGEGQVKDFIRTLLLYGGYNELTEILVNLTSLATEIGRLIFKGYVLTVLVPNDDAMAKLTTNQLSEGYRGSVVGGGECWRG